MAACGTANMRPDFLGAVALNRIARFMVDPRDQRSEQEYFEVVGTDEGIFGCMGLLGCEDVCPKNLPLAGSIRDDAPQDGLGRRKKFVFKKIGIPGFEDSAARSARLRRAPE